MEMKRGWEEDHAKLVELRAEAQGSGDSQHWVSVSVS